MSGDPISEIIQTVGGPTDKVDRLQVTENSLDKLFPHDRKTLKMTANINSRQAAALVRLSAIKGMYLPDAQFLDDIADSVLHYSISRSRGGRNDLVKILGNILNSDDDEPGLLKRITGKK